MGTLFEQTVKNISELDWVAMEAAQLRLDSFFKPPHSLGKLEDIAVQLAGIQGSLYGTCGKKVHVVFCSDNGVLAEGVSPQVKDVTKIVAEQMLDGHAAIAVLCRHSGIDLRVVDMGIAGAINGGYDNFLDRKISHGTANIAQGPAMTMEECMKAVETGIMIANDLARSDYELFSCGEMGKGNTTTSSAILYAITKAPINSCVGRGSVADDSQVENKKRVVMQAVQKNQPDASNPLDVLARLGGFDIAAMVGFYLGSAANKKPIILDGFISAVSALVACIIQPDVRGYVLPSHLSREPGMKIIYDMLGLEAILNLNMNLGEGTGAALAHHIVEASVKIIREMKTVQELGLDSFLTVAKSIPFKNP